MTNDSRKTKVTTDRAVQILELGYGPLPLPAGQKKSPPEGLTGYTGQNLTLEAVLDIDWVRANIAIRLPNGVIGIDVDAYKGGLDTLRELIRELGKLPKTHKLHSNRNDGSGIFLFRVPVGTHLITALPPGIEIIQYFHRYAMLSPSTHPDGRTYSIYDQHAEEEVDLPPAIEDLPELPWEWIERLQVVGGKGKLAERPAEYSELTEFRAGDPLDVEIAPGKIVGVQSKYFDACDESKWGQAKGGRHDTALSAACWMFREVKAEFYSAERAITTLEDWWAGVTAKDGFDRSSELTAIMLWALAEVEADPGRVAEIAEAHNEWKQEQHTSVALDPPGYEEQEQTKAEYIRSQLLTTAGLRTIPRPEYLIKNVLQRDTLAWEIGPSGTGKTFVALDWAMTIATGGGWWHGNQVKAGTVLYLVAEGVAGIKDRVDAWMLHHTGSLETDAAITWLPQALDLFSADWSMALEEVVAEVRPDLIIIDTLARVSIGAEENAAKDAGILVSHFEALKRVCGSCVLLVHHTGKDFSSGGRGSSAFKGAMDAEITISGDLTAMKVEMTKQKNGVESTVWLKGHRIVLPGLDEDGEEIASIALSATTPTGGKERTVTQKTAVWAHLCNLDDGTSVTAGEWWGQVEEDESLDVSKATFGRIRAELVKDGLVETVGKRGLYRPTERTDQL